MLGRTGCRWDRGRSTCLVLHYRHRHRCGRPGTRPQDHHSSLRLLDRHRQKQSLEPLSIWDSPRQGCRGCSPGGRHHRQDLQGWQTDHHSPTGLRHLHRSPQHLRSHHTAGDSCHKRQQPVLKKKMRTGLRLHLIIQERLDDF